MSGQSDPEWQRPFTETREQWALGGHSTRSSGCVKRCKFLINKARRKKGPGGPTGFPTRARDSLAFREVRLPAKSQVLRAGCGTSLWQLGVGTQWALCRGCPSATFFARHLRDGDTKLSPRTPNWPGRRIECVAFNSHLDWFSTTCFLNSRRASHCSAGLRPDVPHAQPRVCPECSWNLEWRRPLGLFGRLY
jgi:hypothetical protein